MPKTTYDHNYSKLYPNTQISAEVMAALIQSDRKSKHQEYDRKSERSVTLLTPSFVCLSTAFCFPSTFAIANVLSLQ